jgi:hypothetical protein
MNRDLVLGEGFLSVCYKECGGGHGPGGEDAISSEGEVGVGQNACGGDAGWSNLVLGCG